MRRFLTLMGSVLFGCASLSLPGCGSGGGGNNVNNVSVSGEGNNVQGMTINGNDWKISERSGITVGDGSAKMVLNGVTVEIKGERISVDGKDRGRVQKGDTVVVKADGQVYVNNEKR